MTPLAQRISKLRGAEKAATEERDSILRDIHELKRDERENAATIQRLSGMAGSWLTILSAANNGAMER